VSGRSSPFTDPALVRGPLYASAGRLARRSGALHRARISGQHAGQVIADLAADALTGRCAQPRVADIGCGRGTTTGMLAQRLPDARLIGLDLSPAVLAAARDRLPGPLGARLVQADFNHLPLASRSCDMVVAAFCLYHCAMPELVIAEITRCLRPGGAAILATKSAESYRELDQLVAVAGLDPKALSRPGLYDSVHSGNLAGLASGHLRVQHVLHHTHRFTFASLADAAEYLATSAKYDIPPSLAADPVAITAALQDRLPDMPVTTTSVVTYVTAARSREDEQ
jgi:ubiquinone/menaquinone biosynthesis C-methylase UbiE